MPLPWLRVLPAWTLRAAVHPRAAAPRVRAMQKAIAWTPLKVISTIALFIFAGLAEIGGGWLVWQTVREKKPWYYILSGFVILCAYGLIPTLQPEGATFSRVYAVYGGVFVVMSYAWGWVVDKDVPDRGDAIGTALVVAGVCLCWFWPRTAALQGASHGAEAGAASV